MDKLSLSKLVRLYHVYNMKNFNAYSVTTFEDYINSDSELLEADYKRALSNAIPFAATLDKDNFTQTAAFLSKDPNLILDLLKVTRNSNTIYYLTDGLLTLAVKNGIDPNISSQDIKASSDKKKETKATTTNTNTTHNIPAQTIADRIKQLKDAIAEHKNGASNTMEIRHMIHDLLKFDHQRGFLTEEEASYIINNIVPEVKTAKRFNKSLSTFKKVGMPTMIFGVLSAAALITVTATMPIIGGTILTGPNMIYNLINAGAIGLAAGTATSFTYFKTKKGLTNKHYKNKYGAASTNMLNLEQEHAEAIAQLTSSREKIDYISNIEDLPINELLSKFKNTDEKIAEIYESGTKNPFKLMQSYFMKKTNRNRLHGVCAYAEKLSNLKEKTELSNLLKDSIEQNMKDIIGISHIERATNSEKAREKALYYDIIAKYELDSKLRKNSKAVHHKADILDNDALYNALTKHTDNNIKTQPSTTPSATNTKVVTTPTHITKNTSTTNTSVTTTKSQNLVDRLADDLFEDSETFTVTSTESIIDQYFKTDTQIKAEEKKAKTEIETEDQKQAKIKEKMPDETKAEEEKTRLDLETEKRNRAIRAQAQLRKFAEEKEKRAKAKAEKDKAYAEEQARIQAEIEAKNKNLAEKEAKIKAEAEKLTAEKIKLEAEKRAGAEEKARLEAEKRAKEQVEAEEKARQKEIQREKAKAEKVAKAKIEAEQKKIAEKKAELEAEEKRIAEEKARLETEKHAKEQAETERRSQLAEARQLANEKRLSEAQSLDTAMNIKLVTSILKGASDLLSTEYKELMNSVPNKIEDRTTEQLEKINIHRIVASKISEASKKGKLPQFKDNDDARKLYDRLIADAEYGKASMPDNDNENTDDAGTSK